MTKAINNYDKTKISMAHVFLQYDQATMIHKYSLDYNFDWLYITFINRTYRINRKTGSVQWSDNDFEIVHEANHNEAMTIYDVLCYSKDRCHLSHEFININSLSSVRTGNLSPNRGFFQNTADFFNGKTVELRNACIALSGKFQKSSGACKPEHKRRNLKCYHGKERLWKKHPASPVKKRACTSWRKRGGDPLSEYSA